MFRESRSVPSELGSDLISCLVYNIQIQKIRATDSLAITFLSSAPRVKHMFHVRLTINTLGLNRMEGTQEKLNYYQVLSVKVNATQVEIRQAYIKESLKYHPDRNQAADATEKFQLIADAYFVLSDPERRLKYDTEHDFKFDVSVNPISIFSEIFNDLMVPEVPNPSYFWQPIATVSGFVILNVPGAVIGGYYGNRAGKVRDMKGVSVYEAYSKLTTERRQEILGSLAKQFFSVAIASK